MTLCVSPLTFRTLLNQLECQLVEADGFYIYDRFRREYQLLSHPASLIGYLSDSQDLLDEVDTTLAKPFHATPEGTRLRKAIQDYSDRLRAKRITLFNACPSEVQAIIREAIEI